jgi:hypothetical protein
MMTATMDRMGEVLETLMADRRVRIGAAIVIAVVLLVSMGFLAASKSDVTRRATSIASHLPSSTLSIPILRSLPEPQPRKGDRPVRVDGASKTSGRLVTARR